MRSVRRFWRFRDLCSAERRSVARLGRSREREASNEFLVSRDRAVILDRDSRSRLLVSSSETRVLESLSAALRSRFLDCSLISCEPILDERSRLNDRSSGSAIGHESILVIAFKFGQASTLEIILFYDSS
ncbi:hypothetical protein X777_16164 [Ooceraea biroi]|uniref:Uncharacterized protein n=1 Tax=Ooceraea biroi TaxID=2015173 RepID=A0A026WW64_OOCBI|nr:hypothetical protein X777_16164 [Ooceraea biroi]